MRIISILLYIVSMVVHAQEHRPLHYDKTQKCEVGDVLEFPDFNILCQSIEDLGNDRPDLVFVLQNKKGETEQVMRLNSIDTPIAMFRIQKHRYQFELMYPGIKVSRQDRD